ncbi:hypothetical protein BXY85_1624 [Roseivirga pacifica]|uniref:Type II CBASS E2 protein domain-containing protein n=1 Tax=Roseivirga pacifica TaxID=1267423 RepID=A0A1I0MQ95_9BACT|nr:hypothetical protein BXY85_1624 [Roseivirga pacifica]SEV90731.1 hypothetical protein SAMN05216290_0608 [Roseivirga pacifica]
MGPITAMEESIRKEHQNNCHLFLSFQKFLAEQHFDWLRLMISSDRKSLIGKGILDVNGKNYEILISYSPFNKFRYDRIYINDYKIKFHRDIHLYYDLSLCLYHPLIDQIAFKKINLFEMIPWISEWIVFYEQWKKYGVWLGKEIKH